MRLPSNDYEFVSLIPLALFVLFRRIQDRLLRRRLQMQHTSAYVNIHQHARFVLYMRSPAQTPADFFFVVIPLVHKPVK